MFNSFQEGKLLPLRGIQPINQIAAAFTAIYIVGVRQLLIYKDFFVLLTFKTEIMTLHSDIFNHQDKRNQQNKTARGILAFQTQKLCLKKLFDWIFAMASAILFVWMPKLPRSIHSSGFAKKPSKMTRRFMWVKKIEL